MKYFVFSCVVVLLLVGCTPSARIDSSPVFKDAWKRVQKESALEQPVAEEPGVEVGAQSNKRISLVSVPNIAPKRALSSGGGGDGSGPVVDQLPDDQMVQISVEDIPIYDFVNLVFGQILKLNFTSGTDLKNSKEKLTLNMTEDVSARDFYRVVVELLEQRDFRVVQKNDLLVIEKIKRQRGNVEVSRNVYWGRTLPRLSTSTKITQIVPVYYNELRSVYGMVRKFSGEMSTLSFDQNVESGSIMITGLVDDVRSVLQLIEIFDQPYAAGKTIDLLYLNYIGIKDFLGEIKNLLPSIGIPLEGGAVGLRLVPVESLNALLVISAQQSWVDALIYWKEKLDTVQALGDEKGLFVYHPQNRLAEELLDVFSKIVTSVNRVSTGTNKNAGDKPNTEVKESIASVNAISSLDVNLSVDPGRNALIIYAYPRDYKNIQRILKQVDIPPRQVLIEVTVAEVTLTDQLEFGLEWYLNAHNRDVLSELGTASGLGIGGSGFNYLLRGLNGDFGAMMNAFAKKDLINIVSTPHVVVLDGGEASITVGTDVPVVTSESTAADLPSTDSASSILRNVQYRSTGVKLTVKPVVHSDGLLTIDLSQELSEAQTNNVSDISSPLILNRSLKTSLALKSGETVLLGGLISANHSKTDSKVPLLGDLPVLGSLFRTESDGTTKTELIVHITPYILDNNKLLDELSKGLRPWTIQE